MNIKGFLDAFMVRTQSKESIRAYQQDLERFEAFLRIRTLRVTQVNTNLIGEYVRHLQETAGRTKNGQLAPATINRRLAILSKYYDYLRAESNGKIRNLFRDFIKPKIDNNLPRAVGETQLQSLIEGVTNCRDRAIILLFLYSGLRLSELQQLNVDSINITDRRLPTGETVTLGEGEVLGKGSKRRRFVVALEALTALGAYLRGRSSSPEPALFLSERRGRLSCRAIQHLVEKWCRQLGIGRIHVHQLRHSFATRLVNAGMTSSVLKELMGHSSFTTTQRYYRIRPERLAREYHAAMEFFNVR